MKSKILIIFISTLALACVGCKKDSSISSLSTSSDPLASSSSQTCTTQVTPDIPSDCIAQASSYSTQQINIMNRQNAEAGMAGVDNSARRIAISREASAIKERCYQAAGSPVKQTQYCYSNTATVQPPSGNINTVPTTPVASVTPPTVAPIVTPTVAAPQIADSITIPATLPIVVPAIDPVATPIVDQIATPIVAPPATSPPELIETYSIFKSAWLIPKSMWVRDGKIYLTANAYSETARLYEYDIKNQTTIFKDYLGNLASTASDSIITVSCIEVPQKTPEFSSGTEVRLGYFLINGFQQVASYSNSTCGAGVAKNGTVAFVIYAGPRSNLNSQSNLYGNSVNLVTIDPLGTPIVKTQLLSLASGVFYPEFYSKTHGAMPSAELPISFGDSYYFHTRSSYGENIVTRSRPAK